MSPDQFNGYGYGDGRAISVGEFGGGIDGAERWELQLKGGGPTPFARTFDGRAVLRSSVREFVVSEAMHHLGVPTTRALCLIASHEETVGRAWYAPRLSAPAGMQFPPTMLIDEPCAITCRAAPSFIRVGSVELWARRAAQGVEGAREALQALVEHAIAREFPSVDKSQPIGEQVLAMVSQFAKRQAALSVSWIRVGCGPRILPCASPAWHHAA
jgi:uncharacterized protein YdiU (UPF0061 family)